MGRQGRGREWELTRTRTVCTYCGTGCGIEVATRQGQIVYAAGYPEAPVNGEFLCTKGRFGLDFVTHRQRLRRPWVRRDLAHARGLVAASPPPALDRSPLLRPPGLADTHVEVDWETALELVTETLAEVVRAAGPDAVGGVGSALCTNEDNYLFQKLLRAGVGTNNVDLCARL